MIFISVPPVLPLGLYLLPSKSAELELHQNAEQELFNFSVMLHFFSFSLSAHERYPEQPTKRLVITVVLCGRKELPADFQFSVLPLKFQYLLRIAYE